MHEKSLALKEYPFIDIPLGAISGHRLCGASQCPAVVAELSCVIFGTMRASETLLHGGAETLKCLVPQRTPLPAANRSNNSTANASKSSRTDETISSDATHHGNDAHRAADTHTTLKMTKPYYWRSHGETSLPHFSDPPD